MSEFGKSTTGRLLSLALAIMLAGGGLTAVSTGTLSLMAMGLPLMIGIAISIIAVPQGADRFPYHIALLLFVLPLSLFCYGITLGIIKEYAPSLGYVLLGLSIIPLGSALLAPKSSSEGAAAA